MLDPSIFDANRPDIQTFYHSNSLKIVPHPLYFLDFALSDFSLFGHLKHYLKENCYPSEEVFLLGIHTILRRVSRTTLQDVFRNLWTDWFRSPHIKIITILKVNPGLFIFVQSRLGMKMLPSRIIPCNKGRNVIWVNPASNPEIVLPLCFRDIVK
jgi:hypothetical protein